MGVSRSYPYLSCARILGIPYGRALGMDLSELLRMVNARPFTPIPYSDMYYLRSILTQLRNVAKMVAVDGPTLGGEVLADNIDWLDFYIERLDRRGRMDLSGQRAVLVESIAMSMAKGNNGGKWSVNYTEEQKEHWRGEARRLMQYVAEELQTTHSR